MRFLTSLFLFGALLSLFFAASVRADEPGHEHESEFAFEYLGITDVNSANGGEYLTFNAAKTGSPASYNGFPSVLMYFVPFTAAQIGGPSVVAAIDSADEQKIAAIKTVMENAEHEAVEAIHGSDGAHCINVSPCTVITPSASTCYRLVFDQNSYISSYKIHVNDPNTVALAAFSEHVPAEFVGPIDFFVDNVGNTRMFLLEEFNHEHNHDDHPQGNAKKTKAIRSNVNALKNKINGAH